MTKKSSDPLSSSDSEIPERRLTTHPSQVSLSPDNLQGWLAAAERFIQIVAESWRTGDRVRRVLLVGAVVFFTLNPGVVGKIASSFFSITALPTGYTTVFWMGMLVIVLTSVIVAITSLPRYRSIGVDDSIERPTVKGLRSFEQKDAEIFSRLQRKKDIQDCLTAIVDSEFRFGQLLGESGCGKSSLLQAGVLPLLSSEKATHQGVYVKLRARNPVEEIHRNLFQLDLVTSVDFQRFYKGKLASLLTEATQKASKPLIIILDQFEQFFVQYKQREDQQTFINELKKWYDSNLTVSFLLSVREDCAGRLVDIQKILGYQLGPNQIFRLEKFRPDQAAAILKVMAKAEDMDVNESFVENLAKTELASSEDGRISPVDLQILVWMLDRYAVGTTRALNQKSFQQLGGVDGLLTCFLERTLAVSPNPSSLKVLVALTDLDRRLRAGTLSSLELQVKLPLLSLGSIVEAVEWLARGDVRLVTRIEVDAQPVYELAHERLIPSILSLAEQELTEGDRAKQLLNRRVNEWQGNNRSPRYLLTWRELRLLRQQRAYIVFGKNRVAKEQLLQHSYKRMRRQMLLVGLPVVIGLGFGVWSFSIPGRIQWVRWRSVIYGSYGVSPGTTFKTASNMDIVAAMKNNPFPHFWIRWFASEVDSFQELFRMVNLVEISEDDRVAEQLLKQVFTVADYSLNKSYEDGNPSYLKSTLVSLLSEIAHVYSSKFNDEVTSRKVLLKALKGSETIDDKDHRVEAMSSIAQVYGELQEKDAARQLLSEALIVSETIDSDVPIVRSMSSIAQAYGELQENDTARQLLSEALIASKNIDNEILQDQAFQAIIEAAGTLRDVDVAKEILSEVFQVSRTMTNELHQVNSLGAIARTVGEVKRSEMTVKIMSDIAQMSQSLESNSQKVELLTALSQGYMKWEETSTARKLLFEALEISENISNESDQSNSLQMISRAVVDLDDIDSSMQILSKVIQISDTMISESNQVDSLEEAANSVVDLRDYEMTKPLMFDVLSISESMDDTYYKSEVMGNVVNSSYSLKDIAAVKAILARIVILAESIDGKYADYYKDNTLAKVSQLYLHKGEKERAEEILDQITKSPKDYSFYPPENIGMLYADLGYLNKALQYSRRFNSRTKLLIYARILEHNAEQKQPELKKMSDADISKLLE